MNDPRRISWKWLAPRLSPAKIFGEASSTPQAGVRPSLPAVEALGDRVMLSVDLPAADSSQILIGLLKSQLPLVNGELAALKIAEQLIGDDQLSHKLLEGYLKLDTALFKFGESLIKGDYKLEYKIEDALLKIDELVGTLEPDAVKQLAPVLSKVNEDAMQIVGVLSKFAGGELEHKAELVYLKLGAEFAKINEELLKIGYKIFDGGLDSIKGEYEFLKFEYQFLKIDDTLNKLQDLALLKILEPAIDGLKFQTLGFIQNFLNVGRDGGEVILGGDFDTGVTLAETSDDLIEELE
jgi:hypothetical protein